MSYGAEDPGCREGGTAGPGTFEELLLQLSSGLLNSREDELDSPIAAALARVRTFFGFDVALVRGAPGGVHPASFLAQIPSDVVSKGFPWASRELLAGRRIVVSSLDDLPPEAELERNAGLALGLRSGVALPLLAAGDTIRGELVVGSKRAEAAVLPESLPRLELIARLFAVIFELRSGEVAHRTSSDRLAASLDAAGVGQWSLDLETGVIARDARASKTSWLWPRETGTLAAAFEVIHADDRERVRRGFDGAVRADAPLYEEFRVTGADSGGTRWIAAIGRPSFDPSTGGRLLFGLSREVTDRRTADLLAQAREARLEAAAELAELGAAEFDHSGGAAHFDERLRDILGIPRELATLPELLGFWETHVHRDDLPAVAECRRRVLAAPPDRVALEYRFLHPDRGERWLHHVVRIMARDATGHAARSIGVVQDVTVRRREQEALRGSLAEIELLRERLEAEGDYLKAQIGEISQRGGIIGRSPAIREVLAAVALVAPTDSTVVIQGETGTGKERVARAIHEQSRRRSRLLVKVNCAALPAGLVESELFGREKGAYTGAASLQPGRFEVADGATLLLDEVSELPLETQAKLLRVLETGEFERLGSPRTLKVDVRILAATNRDLAEEFRNGRFREDLYYRLAVFPIHVPPLRSRTEDVPFLVWSFVEEFGERMGKKITRVPQRVMETLQRHSWPGNVRELRNVIEHGVIVSPGDTLILPKLPGPLHAKGDGGTLAEVERDHIDRVLAQTKGKVKGPGGAADLLGLKPATLYSRMAKLGIPLPGASKGGGRGTFRPEAP